VPAADGASPSHGCGQQTTEATKATDVRGDEITSGIRGAGSVINRGGPFQVIDRMTGPSAG
jgi:hypothetical protein